MSEAKHTPEWKWLCYPDGRKLLCGPDRAIIHCPDAPINVSEEDMAKIAAVPDLMREAEAVIAAWDDYLEDMGQVKPVRLLATEAMNRLADAVARAKGGAA